MTARTNIRIIPGAPAVIACSPPGEKRWGFYQFPDMWRAPGGEIYTVVNVGHDTEIGDHEPSWVFVSRDNGGSWGRIPIEEMNQSPDVITFSDGSQVSFGKTAYIYHMHSYGVSQFDWQWINLDGLDVQPVGGPFMDSYDNNENTIYRYGDIPETERTIPLAWRLSASEPWQHGACTLDDPEMLSMCFFRCWWWDAQGNRVSQQQPPRILRPCPQEVVKLPDDTLVWARAVVNPASLTMKKMFYGVVLYASTDRGRTWQKRGTIADNTELTTDGYSCHEHSLQRMANGDLYCVMRTEMGDQPEGSRYLAAASSSDNGVTWSVPREIAPFSVTPHMLALENGAATVVYGRPGVYVRATADSGQTWSEALPVIGPPEAELLKDRWWAVRYDHDSSTKISCGNLGAVATAPNRFILAYSDFQYKNENGEQCKAVLIQEFTVELE